MRPRLTRSPFTLKLAYNADDVLADTDLPVSPQLYEHYGKALRRSVDVTFTQDNGSGLSDRLRANASWFAAHKSAYVMQALRDVQLDPTIPDDQKPDALRAMLRLFDRWTDAEVNTATARARTAKQFEEFMQPDNARLFPNLRWIASRSADPRASHKKFYDRVWAKNDPFWKTNAPGTEWNCKCDIEETDDPVTDNSGVPNHIPPRGLEGNPAETGQLFTENASYVRGTKGNKAVAEAIETCFYPDKQPNLSIGVLADRTELHQNIETGRILAANGNKVVIRQHVLDGRKNPEYEINGEVADAKRIEGEKGVTDGFKKALAQRCTVVVIDLNAHFRDRHPQLSQLAKYIDRRRADLNNGVVCIIVYGKKTATITSDNATRESILRELEKIKS